MRLRPFEFFLAHGPRPDYGWVVQRFASASDTALLILLQEPIRVITGKAFQQPGGFRRLTGGFHDFLRKPVDGSAAAPGCETISGIAAPTAPVI
jgi:hypothetical protein